MTQPVIPGDPFGSKKPDSAPRGVKAQEVNTFHVNDDTDVSGLSHHHTLGTGRNQASPGSHNHDGKTSRKIGTGAQPPLQATVLSGTPDAKIASLVAMLHRVIQFNEV